MFWGKDKEIIKEQENVIQELKLNDKHLKE